MKKSKLSKLVLASVEIPFVFRTGFSNLSQEQLTRLPRLATELDVQEQHAPTRPLNWVSKNAPSPTQLSSRSRIVSNLYFDTKYPGEKDGSLELHKSAKNRFRKQAQKTQERNLSSVDLRFLYRIGVFGPWEGHGASLRTYFGVPRNGGEETESGTRGDKSEDRVAEEWGRFRYGFSFYDGVAGLEEGGRGGAAADSSF
ncbi:hypothetical protein F3Y22_tig00002237pilonHSYRG01178 [Hibiscus syriacus]|uniref:Uncharacterized protein n=1 Tax=Hibiscus syriacus TaxID=106335 RepID=A0A6A3CY28_HIBSY|nr:hypothetical protein F3Y22_tig00002237pilonHSYRG01178 [Hibiscus syriacus]